MEQLPGKMRNMVALIVFILLFLFLFYFLLLMSLTFDSDGYRSLNVANPIVSRADILSDVVERRLGDMNHLVEVLYFHSWFQHQLVSVFGPGDVGRRPVVNTVSSD